MSLYAPLWLATAAQAAGPQQVLDVVADTDHYRDERVASSAPILTASERDRVANGAVIADLVSSSEGPSRAYGAALLEVSIALLWSAINDETRQPGYTAVTYSELLSGRTCENGRRVLQFIPVPMLSDRWWIGQPRANGDLMRSSGGAVRELTWTSSVDSALVTSDSGQWMITQGIPIGSSRGAWFLVAIDARSTWAEYFVATDPGGRIPMGLASRFATSGVRDNIAGVARFAMEGEPACPIR